MRSHVTNKKCYISTSARPCLLNVKWLWLMEEVTTHNDHMPPQRTQTSLRCLQDILKRSRRLTTKQDVFRTSGLRRPEDVWLRHFEMSNLGRLKNVWFTTSSGRLIYNVLKTSDLRRLEDFQFTTSWGRLNYDVFRTSGLRRPEDVWFTSFWDVQFRTS